MQKIRLQKKFSNAISNKLLKVQNNCLECIKRVPTCASTVPPPLNSVEYFPQGIPARLHCPKSNPHFHNITWKVEENEILHEIFRIVSRFPRYISCSIVENLFPFTQGSKLMFLLMIPFIGSFYMVLIHGPGKCLWYSVLVYRPSKWFLFTVLI